MTIGQLDTPFSTWCTMYLETSISDLPRKPWPTSQEQEWTVSQWPERWGIPGVPYSPGIMERIWVTKTRIPEMSSTSYTLQVGVSDASDLVNTSFARSYTHHQKSVVSYNCLHYKKTFFFKSPWSVLKIVQVCDEPSSSGDRSTLVAYLGGIDLTDGRCHTHHEYYDTFCRYDTPSHPLFSTLAPGGPHSEDFYQGSAPGVTAQTVS